MGKSAPFINITCLTYILYRLVFTQSAPESALITHLPGFSGTLPSKHYSGYVPVSSGNGKRLYYYFVVSERNPSQDPVVLWLNGGPGCSSMDGFVYEHGPFNFEKVEPRGSMPKLHLNKHSWSKVSNIIYLDSPAGVGYSYSGNQSDCRTGDRQTAFDTHIFLLKWFKLYPEFLENPFYIAGESWAGVYVPTLAYEVVKGIDADMKPKLNFEGYMVGNGVTNTHYDENAFIPFVHGMGLISEDLYQEVVAACNGTYYGAVSEDCQNKLSKVGSDVEDLNMYDILEPCYHAPEDNIRNGTERLPESFRKLGKTERPLPVRTRMFGRAWPLRAQVRNGIVPSWPQLLETGSVPCVDDEVATTWLNNKAVRKALHAEKESVAGEWILCKNVNYTADAGSMIKYHKKLILRGIRALMYSGDHDMCVPFTGTEAWTRSMGYKIVDEWRPWFVNHQVAGYIQGYDKNFTFLTIKGAGHTVPEYKPRESLAFYRRWLEGKQI